MSRPVILLLVPVVAMIAAAFLLTSNLTRAVQNPSMSLDMDPTGNTYDSATNGMTVGTIDNCLTTAPANPATHTHTAHLIIQNVEDLVGWQARFNYIGDQMRVSNFSATPFTDTTTGDAVGFANLPIDSVTSTHRGVIPASNIPPGAAGPQTALIGAVYNGSQDFAISPDTPAKAPPDDTSYTTSGGGILASVILQIVGDQSGQASLFMNLDDAFPNPPESSVQFFNGTGVQQINIPVGQLGDGYHGEGATCVALDCTTTECPAVQATETPTATPTPTGGGATPTPTPTPTATGGAATPTPTPTGIRVAATATPTRTPVPTPRQLPATGGSASGDSPVLAYLLVLGGGLAIPAVIGAWTWRLRRRRN